MRLACSAKLVRQEIHSQDCSKAKVRDSAHHGPESTPQRSATAHSVYQTPDAYWSPRIAAHPAQRTPQSLSPFALDPHLAPITAGCCAPGSVLGSHTRAETLQKALTSNADHESSGQFFWSTQFTPRAHTRLETQPAPDQQPERAEESAAATVCTPPSASRIPRPQQHPTPGGAAAAADGDGSRRRLDFSRGSDQRHAAAEAVRQRSLLTEVDLAREKTGECGEEQQPSMLLYRACSAPWQGPGVHQTR